MIWEDFPQLKMEMKLKQEEAAIRRDGSASGSHLIPRKGPCTMPSWALTQGRGMVPEAK